jgi:hypothetical protein
VPDRPRTPERAHLLIGGHLGLAYHAPAPQGREHEVTRLVATAGLLAIVVTAGCGGGSSASPQGSSADNASAGQINLQQSDFPAGWQARPNPVTASANVTAERALYACLASPPPEPHTTANVNSPAFVFSAEQASSNVKLTRTAAQSQADYGVLTKPAFADCARQVLSSTLPAALPAGSSVTSSSVSSIPATAPAGDRVAASMVTVELHVQGGQTTVYADLTTIQRGRAIIGVQLIGLGQPFSTSLQQTTISNVESRANQVPA